MYYVSIELFSTPCRRGEKKSLRRKHKLMLLGMLKKARGKWSKWLSSPPWLSNGYFLNGWGDWSRHGSFPSIYAPLRYHCYCKSKGFLNVGKRGSTKWHNLRFFVLYFAWHATQLENSFLPSGIRQNKKGCSWTRRIFAVVCLCCGVIKT